jgi:hypothetical protein
MTTSPQPAPATANTTPPQHADRHVTIHTDLNNNNNNYYTAKLGPATSSPHHTTSRRVVGFEKSIGRAQGLETRLESLVRVFFSFF